MNLKLLQLGDVAVLDISAVTVEQDEATAKRIPSAESKGMLLCLPLSVMHDSVMLSDHCSLKYHINFCP